jgi:hypothetical protein
MTRSERKRFFEKLLALRAAYRIEAHEATDTTIATVIAFAEQAYTDAAAHEAIMTTLSAGNGASSAD